MTEISKRRVKILIPILICLVSVMGTTLLWINKYGQASFEHISKLCQTIIENYPEAETIVLSSLKEYHTGAEPDMKGNEILLKYGYERTDFENAVQFEFILLMIITFFLITLSFVLYIFYMERCNRRRIGDLTDYLEQVNIGRFDKFIGTQEDEFSQLELTI